MRRRRPPEGSLISLLDVLFILVFAALIQSQARGAVAGPTPGAPAPVPPPPPEPVVPVPPSPLAAVRDAAVTAAAAHVRGAPLVVVRVALDGTVTAIEREGDRRTVGVPLLEKVDDPDIKVQYLGDRSPALRVCGVVARELRTDDLAGQVVVVTPEAALADLLVPLVAGMRRDVERCQREQHALALIVEPGATAGRDAGKVAP